MPKQQKGKKKVAEGVPPTAASEDEAQQLRTELGKGGYKSSEIVKRAIAIGVSPDDVAEVMDLDQVGPKITAALIELVVAQTQRAHNPLSDESSAATVELLEEFGPALVQSISEVAATIPFFGPCLGAFTLAISYGQAATENEEACSQCAVWCTATRHSMVMAGPVLLKADSSDGAINKVFEAMSDDVKELGAMMADYQGRGFLIKKLTSKTFQEKFLSCKAKAAEMMQALQLTMQAVQLKLMSEGSHAEAMEVGQISADNMQALMDSSKMTIEINEKVDEMLGKQDQMLGLQKQMDGKVNTIQGMVADIDVQRSVSFTLKVAWSCHHPQPITGAGLNPNKVRIFNVVYLKSHAGDDDEGQFTEQPTAVEKQKKKKKKKGNTSDPGGPSAFALVRSSNT